MSAVQALPTLWTRAPLVELASSMGGGTPDTHNSRFWEGGAIPWVSPKDMKAFDISGSIDKLSVAALERLSLVPTNSVLVVVRSGILSRTLPIAVNKVPVTINQDMRAFVPHAGVDAKFLAWQMVLRGSDILSACAKDGTTVASIDGARLGRFEIAVAPEAQQSRIVSRIEELMSDLDAAIGELRAAQAKLARYRQSLLKAAIEGKLTAEWRQQNPPQESGADLLERILRERREKWEARRVARFDQTGKSPPNGWRAGYPEPQPLSQSGLPSLPTTWTWASLDMLGSIVSGVAKGSKTKAGEVLREVSYLRVANVQRGRLDLDEVKTILATERDIAELTLRAGDVLFTEGGDRDKLGRGWVWRDEVKLCIHQNHVFRMRPALPEIESEFVSHHGNSFGQRWFEAAGKQTTNLASINLDVLRSFPVPVSPVQEQRQVIEVVRERMEALDRQESAIEKAMRLAAAQRQNILRAAFSGQLVPQDPADEPASVLLDRIRAERTAGGAAAPHRGRKPPRLRQTA